MKKLLSIICSISICASAGFMAVHAESSEYTDKDGNVFEYRQFSDNDISIIGLTLADGITHITIPAEIDGIPVGSVPNGVMNGYKDTLKSITLEGDTNVYCNSYSVIESVTFLNGVTTINQGCFEDCVNLSEINLPSTLDVIEIEAFAGDISLTSITIPENVTKIGQMAFADCSSLTDVIFKGDMSDIDIAKDAFLNTPVYPKLYEEAQTAEPETTQSPAPTAEPTVSPTEAPETTATPSPEATEAAKATDEPTVTEAPSASTETPAQKSTLTVTAGNNGISVYADGKEIDFDDAPPFIDENGRTQIPIRAVAEYLGCKVEWDSGTYTAYITKNDTVIIIAIGNSEMQAGSRIVTMDTTAQLVNDRTYIPVRFVGEALGIEVNWQGE